jgi:hypothetical protein
MAMVDGVLACPPVGFTMRFSQAQAAIPTRLRTPSSVWIPETLRAMVDGMCGWTHRYLGHIEAARRHFDV